MHFLIVLFAIALALSFLIAWVCHRVGRMLDQSHIKGLDCDYGQPCLTCFRINQSRADAAINNAVMDIAAGKPCTHPVTEFKPGFFKDADGDQQAAVARVCHVCGVPIGYDGDASTSYST